MPCGCGRTAYRHVHGLYVYSGRTFSAMSAEDESGAGRVRWDERGVMSVVEMANTALAHNAQPSVCKRSAWRAWFELRLNEHTCSGSKSRRRPRSADGGPPRHTAVTPAFRHALRPRLKIVHARRWLPLASCGDQLY